MQLSETNVTLIIAAFMKFLPNEECWQIGESFPTTELAEMRCSSRDPLFKTSSMKQQAKTTDAELACIQVLINDPMVPLVQLQHALDNNGENICC